MDNYRWPRNSTHFIRLLLVFIFLLFFGSSCQVSALQQLIAPDQPGNTANWLVDNQIARAFAMTNWAYDAGTGNPAGSFYGRYVSGGGNRTSDGIVQQTFITPSGQVNASMYFDRFKVRVNSIDWFRLYGRILDSTTAAYPNETGFTVFTEDISGNYATPGWQNSGWTTPVLPEANRSYIVRIYMDIRADSGRTTGAYLDNIQCNISPANLSGSLNGAANDLIWDASAGVATLDHYNIYRSTTSGGPYGAAIGTSGSNSFSDGTPPAATVVYYVVSDVDTNSLEVRDGAGADEDFSFSPDAISINWDSLSVPVLHYEVAVGIAPGGSTIVNWTDMGLSTSANFTGLTLTDGTMYYCSVRPVDMGGSPISTVFSDGFQTTILTAITVRDGLKPDINFSFLEDRAECNWDHPTSELICYEVAVGTTKYGTDVKSWTDVGHARIARITGLSLASGTRYFSTVRGINAYGQVGAYGGSDGFVAMRDQVLVDTASQTYFHNARVM